MYNTRTYDEKQEAVELTATLEDFDGSVQKWKLAFYEIWRWQMGYNFAYKIYVAENRNDGVFVRLIVKPAFKKDAIGMMEDLGYKNIKVDATTVGIVYSVEREDLDDIYHLFLD